MSSSQLTPLSLNTSQRRNYMCFCDKFFTTYPGIYLHLKSKHANIFQKYKKLKITRLFRKAKDENGCEIYKLDRLPEKETINNNFCQKKIKNIKKRQKNDKQQNIVMIDDDKLEQQPNNNPQKISSAPNEPSLEPFRNGSRNFFGGNQFPFPPNPYLNMNFPFPQHHSPFFNPFSNSPFPNPSFTNFPPMPFNTKQWSIKKHLQRFLNQSQERKMSNKQELKDSLYELMVFIDKNISIIPDHRIRKQVFLSYCDEFQPKFIGPLLTNYITRLKLALQSDEEEVKEARARQIDYIFKFTLWLNQMKMLDNFNAQDINCEENAPITTKGLIKKNQIEEIKHNRLRKVRKAKILKIQKKIVKKITEIEECL